MDLHAGGEPARVVVGGMPVVRGTTMAEKRCTLMNELDHIRKLLLQEPRGYPCQNANIVFPSQHPEAAFGYVILEQNKVYPMMSGHNTICVATALLRSGMISMPPGGSGNVSFKLESPGGLVPIRANCANGKVSSVTLRNVPSFIRHHQVSVNVPTIGVIVVDVIFSGMWYCVVDLTLPANSAIRVPLKPTNGKVLCRMGEMIKVACREQFPVDHPQYSYPGCDILVFCGDPSECITAGSDGKNTVVMSNGELSWENPESWTGMLDRSPCGTGTSAVLTKKFYEGRLNLGQEFVHESIIGTQFIGKVVEETAVISSSSNASTSFPAIITEITGSASITQYCQVVLEDDDPCGHGFTVSDIWL